MKDLIIAGAKKLHPPKADASPELVQAWRWGVAIITGVTALSLAAHIALACGLIPAIYPGFALASDVQEIREERRVERETDLESKILDVRTKQCQAQDGVVKSLHTQTLQKMLVEYARLTKTAYPLPTCDDFT